MKFLKNNFMLLIFLIVQVGILVRGIMNNTINYEVFFFAGAIIWMMFFFYNLFGNGPTGALRGIGSSRNVDVMNYSTLAGARAEAEFKGKEQKKESKSYYSVQVMYAIMVVLNIIGYIVTYIVLY